MKKVCGSAVQIFAVQEKNVFANIIVENNFLLRSCRWRSRGGEVLGGSRESDYPQASTRKNHAFSVMREQRQQGNETQFHCESDLGSGLIKGKK